ncbi:MAG: ABC transporter substrate-binding protein [Chloroflexota bacterium]
MLSKFSYRFVLFSLLVLTLVFGACAAPAAAPAGDTAASSEAAAPEPADEEAAPEASEGSMEGAYKIGFISAITGASFLGVPERNAADMLAAQINAEGGIVGPDGVAHPVEFIMLDSETNPDVAAASAARLIDEEEVDILIAGSTSGNSLAMVPLATEAEVPMIAMGSAGAIVADPETGEVRKWIFKAPHNNTQVSTAVLAYLEHLGTSSVCHLFENSGYGQDTLNQLTAVLDGTGIEIAYSDSFERNDTEFPQMVSVQGAGCDVTIIGSISPGLVTSAVIDSIPDMTLVPMSGACDHALLIEASAGAAEGAVMPCTPLFAGASLPDDSPNKEAVVKFIADYEAATGELPNQFAGIAYDSIQWAFHALATLEDGMDLASRRVAIRDAIESGVNGWAGTSGTFTMSAEDHLGLDVDSAFVYVKVENGDFVYYPPENWE